MDEIMVAKKIRDGLLPHRRQLETQRKFVQALVMCLKLWECLIYLDWAATYASNGRPMKDLIFSIVTWENGGKVIRYVHYMYNQNKDEKSGTLF